MTTQVEFIRFPFSVISGDIIEGHAVARGRQSFAPTKRIQRTKVTVEEEEPPPPTFSEEELEAAKEEAYRHGFEDGEKKGLAYAQSDVAKIEQAALDQVPHIIEQMKSIFASYNQFAVEQKQSLPQLSLALAKKICGDLPPEYLLEQVVHYTTECIEQMLGEPELHVYVHPALTDRVEQRLAQQFANSHEPGDVLIHSDDALALSDCRVEWRAGGMEYVHGTILEQLETLVASISHSAGQRDDAAPANHEEPVLDDVVSDAIAQQLADDDIPPIPEDPQPTANEEIHTAGEQGSVIIPDNDAADSPSDDTTPPTNNES